MEICWKTHTISFPKYRKINKDIDSIVKTLLEWNCGWKIDLSYNRVNEKHVTLLYSKLSYHYRVTSFNFAHNKLGNDGAEKIALLIEYHCPYIETLNLESNKIGNDGAREIANMLATTKYLKYLNLKGNKIGYRGISRLALALKETFTFGELTGGNKSLKTLDLSYNKIDYWALGALLDASRVNKSLTSLQLKTIGFENNTDKRIIWRIRENLKKNRKRELFKLFIILELIRKEKRRKGKWIGIPKWLIIDIVNKTL